LKVLPDLVIQEAKLEPRTYSYPWEVNSTTVSRILLQVEVDRADSGVSYYCDFGKANMVVAASLEESWFNR
jgi:hypothetical protein